MITEATQTIANDKVGFLASAFTMLSGYAGLAQLIQGWLAVVASLLGICLTSLILYGKIIDIQMKHKKMRQIDGESV